MTPVLVSDNGFSPSIKSTGGDGCGGVMVWGTADAIAGND